MIKRGTQTVKYDIEDEEVDGPQSTPSSVRRYRTSEYYGEDAQTVRDDEEEVPLQYVRTRRASARASHTIDPRTNPPQRRRTTTTDQSHRSTTSTTQNQQTWRTSKTQEQTQQRSTKGPDSGQGGSETGKIKPVKRPRKHWLFYVGLLMILGCVLIAVQMLATLIVTWKYNADVPAPTYVSYTVVKLPDGQIEEIHGFIDAQDNLNTLVIINGKVKLMQGPNAKQVLYDPQHAIVTASLSQDHKTILIMARGPYVDEGFEAKYSAVQMSVSVGKGA